MNTNLHLGNQTVQNAVNFFENTPTGLGDVQYFGFQFSSASDLLGHTQAVGPHSSVVHLLTGDTFSVNLPKRTFAAVIRSVSDYFGFPQ